ncbi:putative E3 ubiquitin-protein ligase HERC4 [Silurus asotus]|uniref:E3 ubiquitin-protein ligase HERC4 n=1 Tax=Silurus asotus TaxID=30991 RepID=A0AAD5AHV6_SILAS|nr:putative E3 ubiquitin-protein ligase HERC4 [Silurus asotus]
MLCFWGESVKPDGFGLANGDSVKFTNNGIGYLSPKSRISDISPGKNLIGFIRGEGNASVIRLSTREHVKTGKIKSVKPDGFGLANGDSVKFTNNGIGYLSPKSRISDISPGKNLIGFIRGEGNASVIRLSTREHVKTGKINGQLFTWGQNSRGQLGLGKGKSSSLSPELLESLCGVPLAQISAGGDHSFALSLSGAVFGWGRNSAGQLGLGHTEDIYIPTCVNNLNQKKTISISCGEEHTATLSKGGTVFTFGSGRYGQLGHNSLNDELHPRVVNELWGGNVSQITCGSCDRHYQTSTNVSGLDMDSVRAAFDRLAEKERVLLEVKKVVEKDLLPCLRLNIVGIEALRVFIILPELLRVLKIQGHETELRELYASAILRLDPWMQAVLENFWSELPETFLKTVKEHFHTKTAEMITAVTFDFKQIQAMGIQLRESAQVLQLLYKASCKNPRELKPQDFIIYEINDLCDKLNAIQRDINFFNSGFQLRNIDINAALAEKQQHIITLRLLSSSVCIFTLEAKYSLLKFRDMRRAINIGVRRNALLEDCFQQLMFVSEQDLKGVLQVVYCENLERSNVNRSDFFYEVFKILKEELKKLDTETLKWFTVPEFNFTEDRHFFFGLLCGLAFNNNCVVNMVFPLAMFKKLLDIRPSLDDFTELNPNVGRSLQYLLNYSDDDVEDMCMTYTISCNNNKVELVPDEPGKAVTSLNKVAFVDAYVDYVLNKSVEREFNEFKKGFYKVCDRNLVSLFKPEELREVMLGSDNYDWKVFKENTTYEDGFTANHPTIVLFWKVFKKLSSQDKKAFLRVTLDLRERVAIFSTGQKHVVLVSETGKVSEWKHSANQSNIPRTFSCLSNIHIVQVACGNSHSVVLANDGQLFTWGQNSSGQLGLGKDKPSFSSPKPLKSLSGIPLAQISAGGDHSFALSLSGAVFSWGRNSAGQLGVGDTDGTGNVLKTHLYRYLNSYCGCKMEGLLFTFGSGRCGQLGHNSHRDELRPRVVAEFWGSKVSQIACGRHHTLALVESSNTVYSFGCGEQGQLGSGQQTNQCVPFPVQLPPVSLWIKLPYYYYRTLVKVFNSVSAHFMSLMTTTLCDHWTETSPLLNVLKKLYSVNQQGLELMNLERKLFEEQSVRKNLRLRCDRRHGAKPKKNPGRSKTEPETKNEGQKSLKRERLKGAWQVLSRPLSLKLPASTPYRESRAPYHFREFFCGCTALIHITDIKISSFRRSFSPLVLEILGFRDTTDKKCLEKARIWRFHFKNVDLIGLSSDPKQLATLTFLFSQLEYKTPCVFYDYLNQLRVKRETVLADTLEFLKTGSYDFYQFLKVKFDLEDGIDAGGLLSEFFTLITQEITKDSSITQKFEDSGLFWFSTDSGSSQEDPESSIQYYFGVICGLAFYNYGFMNIGFPLALFKKLLKLSPTLSDLEELSPVEARSLKDLLTEEDDVVEDLYLDFTVKGIELIPNGAEIPVTKANRQKYVDLYIDFVFNKSVESQFGNFRKGFSHGNPLYFWKIFKSEELRDLLYGVSKYEWEELQKGATYKNCGPSDELIQNFWSVFFELSEENQKKFLTFVYGTDRLPIGGLSYRKLIIVKSNNDDAEDRFPSAQTCFDILHLPNYSNIDVLRDKLIHAITYCEVFGQK